jgi:putative ABC transport system substrate-binding protein
LGHEEPPALARRDDRFGFRKRTLAGPPGNDAVAPFPAIRAKRTIRRTLLLRSLHVMAGSEAVDPLQSTAARVLTLRRRDLLALAGSAALTWPFAARAQQKTMQVVGLLWPTIPGTGVARAGNASFRKRLRELGHIESKTITITERYAEGRLERLPELARELVDLKVDVIVAGGGIAPSIAAHEATNSIPIVMVHAGNPIGAGLIKSLAHPGSNVTGTTSIAEETGGKQLEILHQLRTDASRIAFLFNPTNSASQPILDDLKIATEKLNLALIPIEVLRAEDLDAAFARIREARVDGLLVLVEAVTGASRKRVIDFAAEARLPALYSLSLVVQEGGLLSYGPDLDIHYDIAAGYVDKILKGANPADLPVQRPTKFELVINLKTAKTLGITVPQLLLAQADEVIE